MKLDITQKVEVFDKLGAYDLKRLTGECEVIIKYDFNKDKEFSDDLTKLLLKYFKDKEG